MWLTSVVVDDADVVRVTVPPGEDDAPLLVHPDGMEAGEVTGEEFEAVARRDSEVVQRDSSVQGVELS
jgi:hypothetical protein